MANGILALESSKSTIEGRIVWESTPNITTNTSTFKYTVQLRRTSNYTTSGTWTGYVYIYSFSDELEFEDELEINKFYAVSSSWTTVGTRTLTIPHESNGDCPLGCTSVIEGPNGTSLEGETLTADEVNAFELDKIIRIPTVKSATDFNETENPTMTYSNPMGSAATALQACIADTTGKIIYVPYRDIPKTGTSYTFQLTSTERQTLINAVVSGTSVAVKFYVKLTIDGGDHRHWLQKTFSLTSALPTMSPAVVDMNDATIDLTGDMTTLIKYYSTAACSSNAVSKYGATIKSQKVVNGSQTKTNTNGVFAIYNIDSDTFAFSATDSRNNTVNQTIKAKNFINYIKVSCSQEASMELAGETDAVINLTVRGNYFDDTFGAVNNELTLEYRITDDNGDWGEWQPLITEFATIENNTYELSGKIVDLQYDKTYKVQCRASDKLSSATTGEYTANLYPLFDWGENDFNFNVPVSFQGDASIQGNLSIQGNTVADYVIETGTASMGTNGTWYWRKWKSGKAECYGCRNYGNMAITTAWGALYRSAKFKQDLPSGLFNQLPHSINITLRTASGWISRGGGTGTEPTATSTGEFFVCRADSQTSNSVYISFNIIGRWKN
jgi:hypothetical protein